MTNEEIRVYNIVPIGAQNAMKLSDLCVKTGYPQDGRLLRDVFEKLIYGDYPVCNLRHGYFRPCTREELEAYCKIIRAYKCKFNKKEYRLKKALERFSAVPMDLCNGGIKHRRTEL